MSNARSGLTAQGHLKAPSTLKTDDSSSSSRNLRTHFDPSARVFNATKDSTIGILGREERDRSFTLEKLDVFRGMITGMLYLLTEFLVAGGMVLPVWVELTGMLPAARMRVDLDTVGTTKGHDGLHAPCEKLLNIMDIHGLSGWLRRSVDAAIAEYVAPRSLNLDLKTFLVGCEKTDTDTLGVVVITGADQARKGSGQLAFFVRIIKSDSNPIYEETTGLLVDPPKVNAQKKTETTAMGFPDARNRIAIREDDFFITDGSPHLGTFSWEYGYFLKTTLERIWNTVTRIIEVEAEEKLREAKARNNETEEIEQQKKEDLKEKSDEIITSTKLTGQWPSGILSLRVEQINGLEVQKVKQSGVEEDGEDEVSDDLPSAYRTVIINHQRVYKTRAKLKSNKHFDVGTLDIQPYVRPSLDLAADFASCKLTFRTVYGKRKMASHQDGGWKQKRVRLAVNKRYASCLLIEFRKHAFGPDKTVAFSTLWLKDLPDTKEADVSLPVYKNKDGSLERARANSTNDIGEMMGMIGVKVRLWPGLSGYYQNSADQDTNMADVMEVLDCAEDTRETTQEWLTDDESDSDESVGSPRSSSSSSGDSLRDKVGNGT
ncbi:hypothetical protein BDZ94DRAFT_1240598 [Collybia nuda]|uniref:Meiotically up-regulated Mug190 protein third C2 domain-containing protein n=1 Tax=Collybia nuda TaxID=64659 RepID=A0A9P5XW71_9AGAR|nr:hypothetical protein BDZ94DRAFT_1240598 [Collybia nuda]